MQGFTIVTTVLLILGIVGMLWFFVPTCFNHGWNIGVVTGMILSALLILYGIWWKEIHQLIRTLWQHGVGRVLLIILLCAAAGILILAVACIVSMLSAAGKVPACESTVIVLGARVYEARVCTALKGRLDTAYEYLIQHPDVQVIVSGGQGDDEPCTESSLMYAYLVDRGISPDRILQENRSRDTRENLQYSRQIMDEHHLPLRAAIATEGYHQYRALKYAQAAGIKVGAVPSRTPWWLFPSSVIREMYGILQLWFLK